MSLWVVGSVHGAPGATTLAMALGAAWPVTEGRARLVVEADPDGGVLAARFDRLRADRTLADVAVAVKRDGHAGRVSEFARMVWDGLPVVVGHPSARAMVSVLDHNADRLAAAFSSAVDLDVIVDAGRLTVRSAALPLAAAATAVLVVSRCRLEDVAGLRHTGEELGRVGVNPWLVAVGDGVYPPAEVGTEAGLVLAAALPYDRQSAAVLSGEGTADGRLRRSGLWRTVRELAAGLHRYGQQIAGSAAGAGPAPAGEAERARVPAS